MLKDFSPSSTRAFEAARCGVSSSSWKLEGAVRELGGIFARSGFALVGAQEATNNRRMRAKTLFRVPRGLLRVTIFLRNRSLQERLLERLTTLGLVKLTRLRDLDQQNVVRGREVGLRRAGRILALHKVDPDRQRP